MNKVDTEKILKRLIILSWICLSVCLLMKIFSPDLFVIYTNNTTYSYICDLIDQNIVFKYLLGTISSFITINLIWLSILQVKWYEKEWQFWIGLIIIVASTALKIQNESVGIFIDILQSFIYPAVMIGRPSKKYLNIIFINIYYIVFLLISMYIKNISIFLYIPQNQGVTVTSIYVLDTYIMLFLLYLYQIKRRIQA